MSHPFVAAPRSGQNNPDALMCSRGLHRLSGQAIASHERESIGDQGAGVGACSHSSVSIEAQEGWQVEMRYPRPAASIRSQSPPKSPLIATYWSSPGFIGSHRGC